VIERIATKPELRSAISEARAGGKSVGLVPTMGALHDGHIALVRAAREQADVVVTSIFVNPTQFGPDEDFMRYPRRVDDDIELLDAAGVSVVFTPSVETMYGATPSVAIDPGPSARRWEGEVRPGHFVGVATVVAKFFNLIQPDFAFFGEKDYQQLSIIRHMARDLDFDVEVVGCPTVRDESGLALSSRNAYLSDRERDHALALSEALEAAQRAFESGERSGDALGIAMRQAAAARAPGAIRLDYAAVVDADTLEPLGTVDRPARALIAGRVGGTRLIDNRELATSTGAAQ
jgi:pantoate--beta-alanine ligase